MVGMIIRTYILNKIIEPGTTFGALPGSVYDKAKSLFLQTSAYRILVDLDIPWTVSANAVMNNVGIVFAMTEHQYVLWRIAGGEHWCEKGQPPISNPLFYDIGMFLNSAPGANMQPWKLYHIDGFAAWSRGDRHQIAISSTDAIRGICFPRIYNITPDGSRNIAAHLQQFPFAKAIGL
jgi:hypothetical protein